MTDWITAGNTAVVTGGASGIGLAAAKAYRDGGMNVLVADRDESALDAARRELLATEGDAQVLTQTCDVSDEASVQALADRAFDELGAVHCLMNNAGAGFRVGKSWENLDECRQTLETNLWGIVQGCHAFVPRMLEQGVPGAVINTGSKQGITKPPGSGTPTTSSRTVRPSAAGTPTGRTPTRSSSKARPARRPG